MNARLFRSPATTVHGYRVLAALALGLALGCQAAPPNTLSRAPVANAAPLPTTSVYQLPVALTDQNGRNFALAEERGRPMLISMFYTSCQFVCPMLIDTLRDTESKLDASDREQLGVLLVSLDPARDSVAVLKRKADERGVAGPRWAMARTDSASVRKLAAVLGIQYRALADGEFNHTTALILLDGEGRIVGRSSRLGNADPAFVRKVHAVLQAAPH